MVKKNVADLKTEELAGKVVFVRSDLNVPQVGRGRRQAAAVAAAAGLGRLFACAWLCSC